MTKIISTIIFIWILFGMYFRKNLKIHQWIMISSFMMDISLVLYIELTRNVVHTSVHPSHPFVVFHIVISIFVIIAYLIQLFSGYLKARFQQVYWHKKIGIVFIALRFSNLITSFFVEQFIKH